MNEMMNSDLWAIILARLPLKSVTSSKLVCKEWKSTVESPFLRKLFLRHHENSPSSWSLMSRQPHKEVLAQYGCDSWGLSRSIDSYISSFLTEKFDWSPEEEIWLPRVEVMAYTEFGLILIKLKSSSSKETYFVANPITRECVGIPPMPPPPPLPPRARRLYRPRPSGLATQVGENGLVLSYKVVFMNTNSFDVISLFIYSSETGLWSFKTLHSPELPLRHLSRFDPVSLNGSLYWIGNRGCKEVVVSHNFYGESESDHNRCRVIYFPDTELEDPTFSRSCTSSQGFLVYMNVNASLRHKLSVWRLDIMSWEWQIISEISLASIIKTRFDYFPLVINPFDANTMYLQSNIHHCLASTNLLQKGKDKFRLHNNLERSSDGRSLSFTGHWDIVNEHSHGSFPVFVLPRWLYPIPSPPS